MGYNVQTAVDTRHHLIVAHEVTNTGSDRHQLAKMAKQAKVTMAASDLQVIADRGYLHCEEIHACEETGITPFVSKPMTSSAKADGRFDKEDFVFEPETDEYTCPVGSRLTKRFTSIERGALIHRYPSSDCPRCSIKDKALPAHIGVSPVESMSSALMPCKNASIKNQKLCEFDGRPLSIRSAR